MHERILTAAASIHGRIRRSDRMVWILLCLASAGAFVFLRIMMEVSEGETRAFDEAILSALRQPGDPSLSALPWWLAYALKDITSLGGITVLSLITLSSVAFLLLSRRYATALFLLLSITGGWLVSHGLKLGVARPRPEVVPHWVEVHDLSFPSGHAMVSAVTYLTLGALLSTTQSQRSLRIFIMIMAVLLTFMVGASRVVLGVHFPTDVLAGWCAGAAWASVCGLLARFLIGQRAARGESTRTGIES